MPSVDKTKNRIREAYENLTKSEQQVADYFLENNAISDFSSKHISLLLYVSEATLSRFAKKCGFKGYREFVYMYELDFKDYFTEKEEKEISDITRSVRKNYKDIMVKAFDLIDEDQMRRIASKLSSTEYTVPVYGMGSSGYVAREFQLRFMRLGLDVIAITDSQMIAMNASLVKRGSLVLAFSISGTTKVVIDGIKKAKQNGARVVLFTSSKDKKLQELCDEVVEVAYLNELETGTKISPQISLLVLLDVLYSYYFANDSYFKAEKYKRTLSALEIKN